MVSPTGSSRSAKYQPVMPASCHASATGPRAAEQAHAVADAGGVGQEVADGDGPARRHHIVAAVVVGLGDGRLRERGEVLADGGR